MVKEGLLANIVCQQNRDIKTINFRIHAILKRPEYHDMRQIFILINGRYR